MDGPSMPFNAARPQPNLQGTQQMDGPSMPFDVARHVLHLQGAQQMEGSSNGRWAARQA